jgi:hypothetical protein
MADMSSQSQRPQSTPKFLRLSNLQQSSPVINQTSLAKLSDSENPPRLLEQGDLSSIELALHQVHLKDMLLDRLDPTASTRFLMTNLASPQILSNIKHQFLTRFDNIPILYTFAFKGNQIIHLQFSHPNSFMGGICVPKLKHQIISFPLWLHQVRGML